MMATSYARPEFRPQPVATRESTAFWTGGRDGQLLIYRCNACRRFFHPPTPVCWRCRSMDVGPLPVSGRATVASYTVNRQPWLPGFPPPYVVALVELAEERDVRLMTNIVDVDPGDVTIGMAVDVFFEPWDDVWVPLFRPCGEPA
jgi:uncharacterized OB-fold protein